VTLLYRVARPYFSVRVNCHFCGQDSKVEYAEQNSFTCPKCDQYNGWDERGDYNRPLLASTSYCRYIKDQEEQSSRENGLCRNCNLNQELKVAQLAASTSEGEELEEYRRHLERVYRLCPPCVDVVEEVVRRQDRQLAPSVLQVKLEQSRLNQSCLTSSQGWRGVSWLTTHLQTILSLLMFCSLQDYSYSVPLLEPYFSLMETPFPTWISDTKLHISLSVCMLSLSLSRRTVLSILTHLSLLASLLNPSTPHIVQLSLAGLSVVCSLVSSEVLRSTSPPVSNLPSTYSVTCDSFNTRLAPLLPFIPLEETLTQEDVVEDQLEVQSKCQRQEKKIELSPPSPGPIKTFSENSINHEFAIDNQDSCDISSLSLGQAISSSPAPRSPFSSKVYSPSSPTNTLFSPSRPLLKPSRLTNTSWVAGGYWTPPDGALNGNAEVFSRSSSQSSGFVSATPSIINFSSPPNSPPGSIHNGFCSPGPLFSSPLPDQDRFSLLSEPTYRVNSHHLSSPERRKYTASVLEDRGLGSIPDRRQTLDKLSVASEESPATGSPKSWLATSTPAPWTLTITITPCGVLLTTSIAVNVALALLWARQL